MSLTALQTLSSLPGYRADMLGRNTEHLLSSEEGKEKVGFVWLVCFNKIIQLPCLAIVSHIASLHLTPSSCQKYHKNLLRT